MLDECQSVWDSCVRPRALVVGMLEKASKPPEGWRPTRAQVREWNQGMSEQELTEMCEGCSDADPAAAANDADAEKNND